MKRVRNRRTVSMKGSSEVIALVKDEQMNPARVTVAGGITKNMGNYNSLRIDVKVTMPCEPTPEDVDRCYKWTSDRVEWMLQNEIDLVT